MLLIRTSGAIARALDSPLDPELHELLGAYWASLEEFGDELLAEVLIVEAGDTLEQVEQAYGRRLVADGVFSFTVERITAHEHWYDVIWIISDDGSGLVLLIEIHPETDAALLAACRHALANADSFNF